LYQKKISVTVIDIISGMKRIRSVAVIHAIAAGGKGGQVTSLHESN